MLDGILTPQTMFSRLTDLGMHAVAITDHGTLSGIPEFVKSAKDKFKIIAGCELYEVRDVTKKTRDEAEEDSTSCEVKRSDSADVYKKKERRYWHLTMLAKNYDGYHKLTQLTAAAANPTAFYYKPRVDYSMLRELKGNDVFVGLGCATSRSSQICMESDEYQAWSDVVDFYLQVFGETNVYCEIMANGFDKQALINAKLLDWANRKGIMICVTNDAHYDLPESARLQDLLVCVATNKKVDDTDRLKFDGEHYFLRNEQQMLDAFKTQYDIDATPYLGTTRIIADQCEHAGYISDAEFRLPRYAVPRDAAFAAWVQRNRQGLLKRYNEEVLDSVIRQ